MTTPDPTHLVVTLSDQPQDARDLHREPRLRCARCGADNRAVAVWVLPGLCNECAMFVSAVTVAAPRPSPPVQASMFDLAPRPR